jgi:hypothetical protein
MRLNPPPWRSTAVSIANLASLLSGINSPALTICLTPFGLVEVQGMFSLS